MPSSYPTGFDAIPLPDFTSPAPEGSLGQPARPAGEFLTDVVDAVKAIQTSVGTTAAPGPLLTSQVGVNVLVADTTGTVDASAAVQSWVNEIIAGNACGYAPPGDYLLNTPITGSGLSAAQFGITGAGMGVTRFIVPASNTLGGFLFDATGVPKTAHALFRDFTVMTQGVGQGTGLKFAMSSGGATHHRSVTIVNVEICGEDLTQDVFDIGIDVRENYHPYLENVAITGPWGPGITGRTDDDSPQYVATAALVLDNSYGWYVNSCMFWAAQTLVRDVGTNGEGGRITNTSMVAALVGIQHVRTSLEPHIQVENCHINVRNTALDVDSAAILFVHRNHFYNTDDTEEFTGVPRDINLVNVRGALITDNVFWFTGHPGRVHIHATNAASLGEQITIAHNLFCAVGAIAILISTIAEDVLIHGNQYPGTYTTLVDDNSGKAVIADVIDGVWQVSNFNNSNAAGPVHNWYRDSSSPAANDLIGRLSLSGNDSAGNATEYAAVQGQILDPTDTSEDGAVALYAMVAGTLTKVGMFSPPATGETATWGLVNRSGVMTLERFTYGAVDSGGAGKRAVTIPN